MKYPRELKTAWSEVEGLFAQRRKILQALKRADDDQRELEGRLVDAQKELAIEEAGLALADDRKPGPARRKLAIVRDDAQALEARVIGLKAKLADNDEDLLKGQPKFRALANEYIDAEVAAIDDWWAKAVEALVAEGRPRIVRRLALLRQRPHRLRDVTFPALNGVDSLPCRLAPGKRVDGHLVDAMLDDAAIREAA